MTDAYSQGMYKANQDYNVGGSNALAQMREYSSQNWVEVQKVETQELAEWMTDYAMGYDRGITLCNS